MGRLFTRFDLAKLSNGALFRSPIMSGASIEICKHLTIEDYLSSIPQI